MTSSCSSAPARSTAAQLRGLLHQDLRPRPQGRPDQEAAPGPPSWPAPSSAASARRRARSPAHAFEIRPAGRGAPRIDPKPILDGWKLLESTAIYRAAGKNPFFGPDAATPSIGQILLMSKEALIQHVLADPRIEVYSCGREDIDRPGRPPRARLTRVPRRVGLPAHGDLGEVRPRLPDQVGQRVPALVGQRRRHREDQRHPDPRQPGRGLDRGAAVRVADAAGHDDAGPDHLADDLRGRRQHARWATTPTTSTSAGSRSGTNAKAAKQVNAVLKPKQWIKLIDRLRRSTTRRCASSPRRCAEGTERASERTAASRGERPRAASRLRAVGVRRAPRPRALST